MTVIALPPTFRVGTFAMRLFTNQRSFASPFGGSEQVIDSLNDRWMVSLTLPLGWQEDAAINEAFLNSLRGMTNTCLLWHMKRRVPVGSMRGAPVLKSPLFIADGNLIVQTDPGATLVAGDMVGCAGLLFQVATSCTADGTGEIYVPIVNRSRLAAPASTAVVWDRPTAPFRCVTPQSILYAPGYAEGVSLDFVEAIS